MLAGGLILTFFGKWILKVWTHGQDVDAPRMLILGLTATFVSRAWVETQTTLLCGASILVPQISVMFANAIVNIVLAVILARHYGPTGVAWSIPISTLLSSAWGYPLMIRKYVINPIRAAQK